MQNNKPKSSMQTKFYEFLRQASLQYTTEEEEKQHNKLIIDRSSAKQQVINELNDKIALIYKMRQMRIKEKQDTYYEKNMKHIVYMQSLIRGNQTRRSILKLIKNYRHCKNIIKELVSTEDGYVNDLILIQEYIISPLKLMDIVPESYYEIFFSNLEEIYEIHSNLNNEMKNLAQNNLKYLFYIGNCLQDVSEKFKNYFKYYRTFSTQQQLVKDLKQQNSKFASFLISLKQNSNLRYLGWEGFLVKPIQRLPKYVLLLQDFLKHVQPTSYLVQIYNQAFNSIKKVIEENNSQLNPLTELQKSFTALDLTKRLFHYEERMTLLLENQEKDIQLYVFNDLLLVYDTEDHYLRHCLLHERSYVQRIANKRYFSHMVKVIGKNATLTFVGASKQDQEQLLGKFSKLIRKLKRFSEVEVQVIGTEEREKKTFSSYTVYVVQVAIADVVSKCFLRYSDVVKIREGIRKDMSELVLPEFSKTTWLNKHESKVIEQRKVEMEDFILQLLVSEEFQQNHMSQKYLRLLGLDEQFYKLPELSKQVRKRRHERTSSLLVVRANQLLEETDNIQVCVNFHTGTRVELQVPSWFRGIDLLSLVSSRVGLESNCDFRLFESDEAMERMRPIAEDEIIRDILNEEKRNSLNRLVSYFKRKCILLRKYLYLPFEVNDDVRTTLISSQLFFDVRKGRLHFDFEDYCLLFSLYMLYGNREDEYDGLLEQVVPRQVVKQYQKQWSEAIGGKLREVKKIVEVEGERNSTLIGEVVIKLVSKHKFYGMQVFEVGVSDKDLVDIKQYVKMRFNREVVPQSLSIGVQFGKLNLVDSQRQSIYMQFQYSDFDQIEAYSDMLRVSLEDRTKQWTFLTQQGLQIMNLIQEYEYLEIELQKIRRR